MKANAFFDKAIAFHEKHDGVRGMCLVVSKQGYDKILHVVSGNPPVKRGFHCVMLRGTPVFWSPVMRNGAMMLVDSDAWSRSPSES